MNGGPSMERCVACDKVVPPPTVVVFRRIGVDMTPVQALMCIDCGSNGRNVIEVWDTDALRRDFEVIVFQAPYVSVRRRLDGKRGTLRFQHHPRLYFGWRED